MCEAHDNRSIVERCWDESAVIAVTLVAFSTLLALFAHYHPIPGLSIGILALLAGVTSLRPRMHFPEKIAWILLLSLFAGFEVKAITDSDTAATEEKKQLTEKLTAIQSGLNETLKQVNVVKDGMAVMATNKTTVPSKRPTQATPPQIPAQGRSTQSGTLWQDTGRRTISVEKLATDLKGKSTSSATIINDGTNEAGNFANQLEIGLRSAGWVVGGNNIKIGDPAFFPASLVIEISNHRASPNDNSVREAQDLQSALKEQGVIATVQYTEQPFPADFMRIKVEGQ